ncbi:MAG: hypothetical protein HKN26_11180 [Acidimicrobiales bacterium]|nr:hypothetical protein [Acidimicrobiales bacterium]
MAPTSPIRHLEQPPLVRLRCTECDVAWTGEAESPCWVCGDPGMGLRAVIRYTDQDLMQLDFDT